MSEVEELLKKGREMLDKGDLKKAFTNFNKAAAADPTNADAHFGKAEAAVGIPKYSLIDVAQFYRDAIKNDPENTYFYVTYGDFCLSNGLLKQAEEYYTKAIELDPENAVFYYNDLAFGYYNYGTMFLDRQLNLEHDDIVRNAIGYFLKAFKLDDKNALEILNEIKEKGISKLLEPVRIKEKDEHNKLGTIKEKDDYEKLIKSEPMNPYNYLTYGQFCFTNGLLNLGEANFLKAIKLDPENRHEYYNDLSPNYYTCGIESYENDLAQTITKNALRYALHSIEIGVGQAIEKLEK